MSQLGGDGPGCKMTVLAQGQVLQAGESLEEAVWDGGESVVVKVELLEGSEIGKGRNRPRERVATERKMGELGESAKIRGKSA